MSPAAAARPTARDALLDAAVTVIRGKGLNATTVDDLCIAAGVTKGAFFHHFESKEALAVAAANHWSTTTGALFAAAPYHDLPTGRDRVLAYLDLRAALIRGSAAEYTCVAGTMVQEAFGTSEAVRAACEASIFGHAQTLVADLDAAIADAASEGLTAGSPPSAWSLAQHMQVVLQGAFVVSKAAADPQVALDSIGHLRAYIEFLIPPPSARDVPSPPPQYPHPIHPRQRSPRNDYPTP